MSDEQESVGDTGQGSTTDEDRAGKRSMGDGIKEGLGVLSAFKDALEETIQEARDRGDLSTDRAKEVMKETLGRAQTAAEEARGRLDFVTQAELETVRSRVDAMQHRLKELEESVFGASQDPAGGKNPVDRGSSDEGGDTTRR